MTPSATLWVLACALAGVIAFEITSLDTPAPPPAPASVAGPSAIAAVAAEPTANWTATILARPLFDPDRHPPSASSTAAEAPASPQDLPRLAGIMISADKRQAIFSDGGDHSTVAAEGATVGAWRIVAIRPGDVDLDGPDGRHTVRPSFSNAAPAADPVTKPFSLIPQPSGAAIFNNMPGLQARKPR